MTLAIASLSVLVILSNFMLENVATDSSTVFQALEKLTKAVERLEEKIQLQTTSINNIEAKVEIQDAKIGVQSTILKDLQAELVKVQNSSLNNLQVTTTAMQVNILNIFEEKFSLLSNLVNNSMAEDQKQATSLKSLDNKVDAQGALLANLTANVNVQATLLSNMAAESKFSKNSLKSLESLEVGQTNELNDLKSKVDTQNSILNNLQSTSNMQAVLLTKMNSNQELQATSLTHLEAASILHKNSINNLGSTAAEQTSLLNNLATNADMQVTLLTILQAQSQVQATSLNNLVAEVEWHEPVPLFKTNRTFNAVEGDDVEIWCVVRGTPLPEIKWTRENVTLESDRVTIEDNGKVLRIQKAQWTDEGTYKCVAANGVGTPASQSVRLEVYGQFLQCKGVIESDKGNLEVEPSNSSCLSVIKLQNTTGFRLQLDSLMTKPIVVIPEPNHSNSNAQFIRIDGSKNVSYEFGGKSLAIVVPPLRERMSLYWTGLAANNSEIMSSTKYVNDLEGTLEWETTRDGTDKIFWAFDLQLSGELNWTLNAAFTEQDQESSCGEVSFSILKVRQDGNVTEIQKTCAGSSEGSLKLESSSKVLVLLHSKSDETAKSKLMVTWNYYDEPLKKSAEGIIVGTDPGGAVVIPFNSTQTKTSSSKDVNGLAYDWNSRRVYWLEDDVGLMRASWDDSKSEVLLSDTSSSLVGMAIEPISGNIYYGNWSSKSIRICNNDATRCSSIANNSDLSSIDNIAAHWSKGFLFWSIWKQKIVRANLDGSNAIIILQTNVTMIAVDEYEDRLYWGSPEGIGSCDLNGQDIRIVPNLSTGVQDVAIDGENVYYGDWIKKSIKVTSKLGTNSRLVADLQSKVYHLAFFGTQDPNQPPNPCENSECAYLCSLITPRSYRCLCPDSQELDPNGKTCKL